MNPIFNAKAAGSLDDASGVMTAEGTMNKTVILLIITVVTGIFTFNAFMTGQLMGMGAIWGSAAIGIVLALIISFKPNTAPFLSPVYAAIEGVFVGGLSALYAYSFPGIVIPAIGLTFGVLLLMMTLYRFNIIPVTQKLRTGIIAATGAVMVLYLVSIGLSFVGISIPLIHESGIVGIGFSVFVVGLAAFNLLLDFDFIDQGVKNELPKGMEWYAAFGLLVTLVWLYVEILRLLAKLNDD